MKLRLFLGLFLALTAAPVLAQETQFEADLRREKEHVADACGDVNPKAIANCVYTVATQSPFHVALGSLAPQNGFAFGLAFSEHYTPNEAWRLSWNADAVSTFSGSWRTGVYMKIVHTPATAGVVVRQPGAAASPRTIPAREFPVVDLFVQTISLKTLNYFGPGQDSLEAGRSQFGEWQNIVGASAIYPLSGVRAISGLRPALLGGVSGRFVDIRPPQGNEAASIEELYGAGSYTSRYSDAFRQELAALGLAVADANTVAPGLARQRPFLELREGIRFKPSIAGGRLRFNYLFSAQQFRTSSATRSSFNRWTMDLQHEIPLYRSVASGSKEFNGPDECAQSAGAACPPVQWSRNREGAIGLRLLVNASTTSGSNRVPFYFQPTLGGSDVNGERMLASYQDYRFRAPNRFVLQESLEHSLWGPFGVYVLAEQGKVTSRTGDLDFANLASSTTVGLTLRAGGFPLINLSFAWGDEGHHVIGSMNSTLLGGSARPSLY